MGKEEIEVKFFDRFEEGEDFRKEWDDFIESIEAEIFLTYEWCRIWWKYFGTDRKLMIFTFRVKGKLIGILPMFAENIRLGPVTARVLKIVGTDFTPVAVSVPIMEKFCEQVVEIVLESLCDILEWDIIYIGAICGKSSKQLTQIINNSIGLNCNGKYKMRIEESDVQTYFKLADSWEKQLKALNKKQRKNFRQAYKIVAEMGSQLSCELATESTAEEYFKDFVILHQAHWNKKGQAGHFVDWPLAYEFHREMLIAQLKLNRLRLFKITLGNETLGFKYGYRLGHIYFAYLMARNDTGRGEKIDFNRIAFGEQVKYGLLESIKYIDSMRGYYAHKVELGGRCFLQRVYIFGQKD